MTLQTDPCSGLTAEELIGDPLIGLVMARDGVLPDDLRRLLARVRDHRRNRQPAEAD